MDKARESKKKRKILSLKSDLKDLKKLHILNKQDGKGNFLCETLIEKVRKKIEGNPFNEGDPVEDLVANILSNIKDYQFELTQKKEI